jgi:hypothetical protein
MLTPHLEKLILTGRAVYRTFVAGNTNRHILPVGSDRFIIITDLTWYSFLPPKTNQLTLTELTQIKERLSLFQVRIKSYKSENSFVFRNQFFVNVDESTTPGTFYTVSGGNNTQQNVYLVHTNDVAIIFTLHEPTAVNDLSIMNAKGVGFPRVSDYAKEGLKDAIQTLNSTIGSNTGANYTPGGQIYNTPGSINYAEFTPPVDATTDSITLCNIPASTPLLQIGYVEIYGNPTDISATI